MGSKTEPFKVTCRLLDGRINTTDGLIFFDAILYHAWFLKNAPQAIYGMIPQKGDYKHLNFGLPLRRIDNKRYSASVGFFKQYDQYVEYWNKRADFLQFLDFHNENKRIDVSKGEYKNYRVPQVIKVVGDIEFYGYGTISKIKELLEYIPAIGKKPGEGWGIVKEWVVEPFEEDWSYYSDKYGIMRPIPIDEYKANAEDNRQYTVRQCSVLPPSWKQCNQRLCYVPEVIQ